MSSGETGSDMTPAQKGKVIEKAKESEYWDKPLPGVNKWTVGELVEKLVEENLFNMDEDTPGKLYRTFEKMNQEVNEYEPPDLHS